MKKWFLLLLAASASLYSQTDCRSFRTGTFEYTQKGYEGYRITRTASSQIETNSAKGYRAEAMIKWVSDCEYSLTYTKTTSNKQLIGKTIKVRILRTDGQKYTFHATMGKHVLTTEVRRVK